MALPTASAGWKDLFDDSSSTEGDWAGEAGCEADGWAVGAGYPIDKCSKIDKCPEVNKCLQADKCPVGAGYAYEDPEIKAQYDYDDRSDYENSDLVNYEDGIIDNFHFNKKLGYPEYDSGYYQSSAYY